MANRGSSTELKKLFNRDFNSKDKTKIIGAYQRFIDLLSNTRNHQQIHGERRLIFQCLTQIFLTDNHRYFSDDQLRKLLDVAWKSRLLSMSETHLLDSWSRNLEEREFERPDEDEDEEDEDWTDETTESESEEEEVEAPVTTYQLKKPDIMRFNPQRKESNRKIPNEASPKKFHLTCFKCGEEGHKKIDCRTKPVGVERIFNDISILINSKQNDEQRKNLFNKFCLAIERIDDNSKKIFIEKEEIFYSFVCHVAQRPMFFTDDEFHRLFDLRQTILPQRYKELKRHREQFTRQRPLKPFNEIEKEIRTKSEIHPTIFNDFEEILVRTKPPISAELFDLIKYFCQSSISIESRCFDHWTEKILFESKRNLFNETQLVELRSALDQRKNRSKRNEKKSIWKERLNEMKKSPSNVDLDRWIAELSEILESDESEKTAEDSLAVDHGLWYFSVLSMTSCFSLNKNQYETLLKNAVRSFLFNKIQKSFLQIYLDDGQPPISMKKLNEFKANFRQLSFDELKTNLLKKKPEGSQSNSAAIPFIDNHVRSEIISLVQMICADREKCSLVETKMFLDEILSPSSFLRPLTPSEEQKLKSFESNFLSIEDLETIGHSIKTNWSNFINLLQQRSLSNENAEVLDHLVQIVIEIFSSTNDFSLEQCDELKSLIRRTNFDRTRYELIHSVYDEYRKKKIQIDAKILNELSTKILQKNLQAYREFFQLLNSLPMEKDETTIEFELIRCFVSGTVLIICQMDYSTSNDLNGIPNELKTIIDHHSKFFSTFFTSPQFSLINQHLNELSPPIRPLIDAIRTNVNDENLKNLCDFIEKHLKDKNDVEEIVQLILWTFDEKSLTVVQTSKLTRILHEKIDSKEKSTKNLLQYLLHLLHIDQHQSPKALLEHFDDQTEENFVKLLKSSHSSHAPIEWKEKSIECIRNLSQRKRIDENFEKILRQASMFQTNPFKDQLVAILTRSTTEKYSDVHRELFRCLDSSDASLNDSVVHQIHRSLVEETLPSNILLNKFIQAIEMIVKNPLKYSQYSLDNWAKVIAKNRGKIFINDVQCDELLLLIFLDRWNLSKNFLKLFDRLVQSRMGKDRQELFRNLSFLLKQTKMKTNEERIFYLPTIADRLFQIVREVIFNQKFSDDQVRNCIEGVKNSWLFNDEQRQSLREIF